MDASLKGWMVAVLGGDYRMLEHMRQAREAGATVRHYGSPEGSEEAAGAPAAASLAEAMEGARLISCPIPGIGTDDSLYAPFAREKLFLTPDILGKAAEGALLFSGRVTPGLAAWAEDTPVTPIEYGDDDPLAILHAIPTAEGAIQIAIERTDRTISCLPTLCLGMGRVGITVVQAFRGLDADVTVGARDPSQLARARAMGARTVHIRDLPEEIGRFPLIVSSASGLVLTREVLEGIDPEAVVMDLCSPPGSVDFDAAEELGREVVWARGQAGTAPRSTGSNEWQVMMRILGERLAGSEAA